MQPIGIFGGTFDPIHCGHLRTAFELWQELHLAEVRFLPTGTPPHRDQLYASAELRLKMVRAAVADQPASWSMTARCAAPGLSYSVDTLTELRREYPHRSLCLLLGMDAFLGLPQLAPLARAADARAHRRRAPPRLACPDQRTARARSWSTTAPAASASCTSSVPGASMCTRDAAGDLLDRAARAAGRRAAIRAIWCPRRCGRSSARRGAMLRSTSPDAR